MWDKNGRPLAGHYDGSGCFRQAIEIVELPMNLFRTKSIEQSISDADEPGRKLKRSLSTWDLMIMGVAVAVGAGIFSVGAKAAAHNAGPAVTVSFVLAAITCALAIMCYAEFA